jgi:tetratricopeptide (TPR) repeat protein
MALILHAPVPLNAQADNGWIGKRVVQKFSAFQLQLENQVVDTKKRLATYRVEQVIGPWLFLHAPGLSGWAQADQVVPVEHAIEFFTDYIRANPGDPYGYTMRAKIWREEKKELDMALGDYNEAIRINPNAAYVVNNRGSVWAAKKEYDKAIADYNEAIRLDPKFAGAYAGRGNAWAAKQEYGKAIPDYNKAIRLDPKYVYAYTGRGNAWAAKKEYDKAIADYNEVLRLEGWRGRGSLYAVILGHFAALRGGRNDQAKSFLDDAAARCDKSAWPYPVVEYLRGETEQAKLLAAATDNDKMTEARCYLALDLIQKKQTDAALAHFRWVKEHGNPSFVEFRIALAELNRLTSK